MLTYYRNGQIIDFTQAQRVFTYAAQYKGIEQADVTAWLRRADWDEEARENLNELTDYEIEIIQDE